MFLLVVVLLHLLLVCLGCRRENGWIPVVRVSGLGARPFHLSSFFSSLVRTPFFSLFVAKTYNRRRFSF